ncbi:dethiobiotin synthase [Buchnera aphidicola (Pemphigus obesinymphae)]|uniref:dethiobiotin synthase n=1 Tax=Buchnera aphidicola TaxID=9 RepID=UPI002238DC18|nr:dethiobiotin synthase [Buchnera aphidicola]MCW5196699.1 dethiobiotin synthase [Buchnera aphidicola (Pemphigus obesinymphae)]
MNNCWFVTGTDTNIGKTIASSLLLINAKKLGYRTAGYKPVASGIKKKYKKSQNNDALIFQKLSSVKLEYKEINPFCFYEKAAPHILSIKHNIKISFEKLSLGLFELKKKSNWILIEGAGGWYTPLSRYITYADWVFQENLPVVMVVAIKLGCINHAILTSHAILKYNLNFSGWIANNIKPKEKFHEENILFLKKNLQAPFLGEIPYFQDIKKIYTCEIPLTLPK